MTENKREVFLDLSGMEPPEPFVQSLAALDKLQPGQFLHLTHRRAPALLYPELEPRGFVSDTREHPNGQFHIMIWRQSEQTAGEAAIALLKAVLEDE